MASFTDAEIQKAAKFIKQGADTPSALAAKMNVPMGQVGNLLWLAEPVADPKLKIAATGRAIRQAREKQNLRWERIAARTGLSKGRVLELYTEAGGDPNHYTGRGRSIDSFRSGNGSGAASSGKKTGGKTGAKGNQTAGRQPARTRAQRAQAGAATGSGKQPTRTRRQRGTDPS